MQYRVVLFLFVGFINSLWGQLYYDAPNASAYNPLNHKYLITNEGSGEVFQIDRAGNKWLFANGLASPRNVAMHKLPMGWVVLVLDSNRMVVYDTSGSVLGYETVSGVKQLQDCVYDSVDQILYTSDRLRGVIYKTRFAKSAPYSPTTSIWVSGLKKPSAMVLQKNRGRILLVQDTINSGLIAVSLLDSSVSLLRYLNLSNVMGMAEDDQGNLYFSAVAEQNIYQLNKYYKGSPKALIREPKPGDLTVVGSRNEWVYTCILCGKVYVAALHIFGPSSEAMGCAGDSIDTYKNPFLKNIGTFESGNEFVLQLSDSQGDFSKGYELNRVKDTLIPAVISGVLPVGIPSGLGYKIRWNSTKPAIDGWLQMSEILPVPTLSLSSQQDTFFDCERTGIRLKAQDSVELVDFSWKVNGREIKDSTQFLWVMPDSALKVVVAGKLASSGCVSKDSVRVIPGVKPILGSWETEIIACQGDSISLGDTSSSSGIYNYSYRWRSFNLDSTWTNTAKNPRVIAKWTDSFYVTIQNSMGCKETYFNVLEVTTRDSIKWWKRSDSLLEVVSQKGGKLSWFRNGIPLSFMDSKMELPDTGLYQVCTQIELGCSHCTDTFRVKPRVEKLGRHFFRSNSITVFPNPTANNVNIRSVVDANWVLFSLDGKRLLSGSGLMINLENLSPGTYLLNIQGLGSVLITRTL
jgi:hypothetical protein